MTFEINQNLFRKTVFNTFKETFKKKDPFAAILIVNHLELQIVEKLEIVSSMNSILLGIEEETLNGLSSLFLVGH